MDELLMRRRQMLKGAEKSNIAYEAFNLSFGGTNYIDTGLYLFSAENINKDFELVATDVNCRDNSTATVICHKLDGPAYGFLVRTNGSTQHEYKGTIQCLANYDVMIIVRRISGVLSVEGDGITNLPVPFNPNTVFNQPLVLGCALQSNGVPYRYTKGTIGHIIVRWL